MQYVECTAWKRSCELKIIKTLYIEKKMIEMHI